MVMYNYGGDNVNDVNVRFNKLRKALGMSQEEIGNIIGIKRSGVSNIEGGTREVTPKHIKFLCMEPIKGKYVNENWLRTGAGGDENMFIPEDMKYFQNVGKLGNEKNEFKKFYFNMMMGLPDEFWEYVYKEFKNFEEKKGE